MTMSLAVEQAAQNTTGKKQLGRSSMISYIHIY
jgi:hypothetical protein